MRIVTLLLLISGAYAAINYLSARKRALSDQTKPSVVSLLLWLLLFLSVCPSYVPLLGSSLPSEFVTVRMPSLSPTAPPHVVLREKLTTPVATLALTSAVTPMLTSMPTPTFTPSQTSTPTPTPAPTPEVVGVALNNLKVYSCPSKESEYTTSHIVSKGERFKVIGWNESEGSKWYLIRDDGVGTQQWWVVGSEALSLTPSNYASYIGRTTCRYDSGQTSASSPYAVVNTNTLNVRSGPGTGYSKVAEVHQGERLAIQGRSQAGNWLQITTSAGVKGWVATQYVNPSVSIDGISVVTDQTAVIDPRFRADSTSISSGNCTNLRWDVDGVKEVYLDGTGKPGHGVQLVCPGQTQTYTLKVVNRDGQELYYSLTIQVSGTRPSTPLTIHFQMTKIWCTSKYSYVAEFSISAQGGNGRYTYYRDDLNQLIGGPTGGGATYRVSWSTCGGAPGTFIVRSGDGQEARDKFWVNPPACCGK